MRLAAALCLALMPLPALAFTPERAALMVDAIRGESCALSGERAEEVLSPLGLDPVEVQSFIDVLYAVGLFELSDDDMILSLSPDLCEVGDAASLELITAAFVAQENDMAPWRPDFDPEMGGMLIGILREMAGAMTTDQAAETLPQRGFDPILTRDIVSVLVETGAASLNEDRSMLTLGEALCSADSAGDGAAMAALIEQWLAENADDTTRGTGDE